MVNYDKSIIYKLCCKDPSITDEYVGSTVNFTRRKCHHKSDCCNENSKNYNYRVYQFIRDNGGWENWSMVELERYCATDRKDLNARERFWFEELGATLNTHIPNRSQAESQSVYYQKNKAKIAEYHYERYHKNKAKIAEHSAEWYQKNKQKIAEYGTKYRQKNKQKIAEKVAEKLTCECGCIVRRYGLARHRKNAKHKKLMEEKEN